MKVSSSATSPGGSIADRAINYVLANDAELFHDQYEEPFIAFQNDLGQREVWPLKSKAASNFIRWTFYHEEARGLPGEGLATARATLDAQAQFQGARQQLFLTTTPNPTSAT